jgi:DNA polymerase-3 subunit epsilon
LDYCVVDVETANQARSSICQIGIAVFRGGQMVDGWQSLVNPEAEFSFFNIRVHGIRPEQVQHAPCWAEVFPQVEKLLGGVTVASHTNFDQAALNGACLRDGLPAVSPRKWLDTCGLSRDAWPNLENHKLPTLARHFGIAYKSHDALEDARAAGEILALAVQEKKATLADLLALPGDFISKFTAVRPASPRPTRRRYAAY